MLINKINNPIHLLGMIQESWKIGLKKVKHNPVRGAANAHNSLMMMGGETGHAKFLENSS